MPTNATQRRWRTDSETAEPFGINRATAWRKIGAGVIPAVQLGGRQAALRVDADELEAWLTGADREDTAA